MGNLMTGIGNFLSSTGFAHMFDDGFFRIVDGGISGALGTIIMLVVACVLLYLAIVKQFEPLLLLPIAFGTEGHKQLPT